MSVCYLAGPDPGDQIAVISEDVKYLQDPSGVSEHGDAGVGDGQIQSEQIWRLERGPLAVQDEDHQSVAEPGEPPCRHNTSDTRAAEVGGKNKDNKTDSSWVHLHHLFIRGVSM